MHWFQHHDEPTNGRFDGEDSNYGLVDQRDRPYEEVTGAFAKLNAEINSSTWRRGPFPAPSTRKGWPENEPLSIAGGGLDAPVNLLPAAGEQNRTNAICDNAHGAHLSMHPAASGTWFASARFTAGVGLEEKVLWLEDFEVRWEYGNQKGNRRPDLDGLEVVGVALPEAGGKGELHVLALELLP